MIKPGRDPGLDPGQRSQAADARLAQRANRAVPLEQGERSVHGAGQGFRGMDAERIALALVKELRNEYHLPAYIFRTKDFPGKSLMRGTPPTVPSDVMTARYQDAREDPNV